MFVDTRSLTEPLLTHGRGICSGEERAANWYLLNGGVIHLAMDGLTGGYSFMPHMSDNYQKLDNRANGFLGDAGIELLPVFRAAAPLRMCTLSLKFSVCTFFQRESHIFVRSLRSTG